MVIGNEVTAAQPAAISIDHMGDLTSKIDACRTALSHYRSSLDQTKRLMDQLASRSVRREDLVSFFGTLYDQHITATLKETEKQSVEDRRKERAGKAFLTFMDRFEIEENLAGATWWNAMNAYTGMMQHDRKLRGTGHEDKIEKRASMNLLGVNTVRAHDAFTLALQLAS